MIGHPQQWQNVVRRENGPGSEVRASILTLKPHSKRACGTWPHRALAYAMRAVISYLTGLWRLRR